MVGYINCAILFLFTFQIVFSARYFRIRDVSVMTFYQNQFATNSKGQSVPQIYCAEGNACSSVGNVKSVQCYNKGVDMSGKVNWKCESNIVGDDFSVDYTNPTCEGYSSPNDNDYAFTDSCIVIVKLSQKAPSYVPPKISQHSTSSKSTGSGFGDAFIYMVIFFGLVGLALSSCCSKSKSTSSSSGSLSGYAQTVTSIVSNLNNSTNGLRHRNVTQSQAQTQPQQTTVSHGTSNNSAYPVSSISSISSQPQQTVVCCGLRHRNVTQSQAQTQPQQTTVSHGTSNNSAYLVSSISSISSQPQQTVVSHGTSNNQTYPNTQINQTTQSTTNTVQQTVVSHGTSNNSAYPNPSSQQTQGQQGQPQQTVSSHGTTQNSKYQFLP